MDPSISLQNRISGYTYVCDKVAWLQRTVVPTSQKILKTLKVHKHENFFFTFFAETETLWSQGPVTRDF